MPIPRHSYRHPTRRGVAMLLIIIALATGTLLATAYLASRDNSAAIGSNVVEAAAARWAAESGLEYGVVILQTEKDWRTAHTNGTLIADHPVGEALVTLDLMDLETSGFPTDTTRYVRLTSTAVSNGLTRVSRATAHVPVGEKSIVDLDLGEFGAFATREMTVTDQATVARWMTAPLAGKGERVQVGTTATASASVKIAGQATPIDTSLFAGPTASGSLLSISNGSIVKDQRLTDNVVVPAPPGPGVLAPLLPIYPALTVPAGGKTVLSTSQRYDSITIQANGQLVLQGNLVIVSEKNVTVGDQAKIVVESGQPRLVAWGDMDMNRGGLVLEGDDTSLTIFVGDDLTVASGYIGDAAEWSVLTKPGMAGYIDPSRITFFPISTLLGDGRVWAMTGDTLAKGRVYAPSAALTLADNAALYGNAVTNTLTLMGQSGLYHDPTLNTGRGYTNPRSKVYGNDQLVKLTYKTLASMDDASVLAVSVLENVQIKGLFGLLGAVAEPPDDPSIPGVPTERPVPVEIELESTGLSMDTWEDRGADWRQTAMRVESDCRALSTTIAAIASAQFAGATALQRTTRRTDLATRAASAADAIAANDFTLAQAELTYIYERCGGNLGVTQFMVGGTDQLTVKSESSRLERAAGDL